MKKAFTLIELIVVLAIISLLIGLVKNNMNNYKAEAEAQAIVDYMRIIEKAFAMYYYNTGSKDKVMNEFAPVFDIASSWAQYTGEKYLPKNFANYTLPRETQVAVCCERNMLSLFVVTSSLKVKEKCKSKLSKTCSPGQLNDYYVPSMIIMTDGSNAIYFTYILIASDGTCYL